MIFNIIATDPFERKLKRLAKKYKSFSSDLSAIIDEIAENPTLGTPIGKDCYKIRVVIAIKGKDKRGGASMITFVHEVKNTIFLMNIYDKSEQTTISAKKLQMLIDIMTEE